MSPAPTLSVENLSVEYRTGRGPVRAARGVSFDVGEREVVALIGESACGKTTAALAILRLLPPAATVTTGTIYYRSGDRPAIDVLSLSARDLRAFRWAACALVPQGAISALNPVMRVSEHFEDTARAHDDIRGPALRRKAMDIMTSVRLDPDRAWHAYPHELSGGQRQRVSIALALLLAPRVLILDEPTTALDILTQRSIIDVLGALRASRSVSLVFISHDFAVATELADRIVTMYAGRVVEVGPVDGILEGPLHPYTLGLVHAVPTLDDDGATVRAIPGSPPDLVGMPPGCPFAPRCPLVAEICRAVDPPLEEAQPGRSVACHRWRETAHVAGSGAAVDA